MKFLLNGLICTSLLILAVGCGKDNVSSGGSSSNPIYYDPSQLTQTSQQAMTALSNWYNGTTEGTRALGLVKIQKIQSTQNSNQNCSELDLKIISVPYCYSSYSSNSGSGSVISEYQATLVQDGARISSRNNPELQSIFSGAAGKIVQASTLGNNIMRVDVFKDNVLTSYIIDRNYHSLLNPVQKFTNTQSPVTVSTQASCVNNVSANLPAGCSIR